MTAVAPAPAGARNSTAVPWLMLPTLSVTVMTVAMLQTMVVPVVGRIGEQLDAGTTAVGWVLTANLLAAAVFTPVLGRLADLRGKRPVLIGILVVVLCGSLLAALTQSLPLLILARVLQGASFALFPIGVAILRDELPAERLVGAMGLLSGTLGVGGGVGMVVTGLLVHDDTDYRRVFWFTAAVGLLVLVAAVASIPARASAASGPLDWIGATLLAVGLVLVLLALSEGGQWGWRSVPTIGCGVVGAIVLAAWFVFERRTPHPLVPPTMLTRRPVLVAHVTALLVGAALFVAFLACVYLVQTPRDVAGLGFGANVLETGAVYLLPGAAIGVVASACSGRLLRRFAPRGVLIGACTLGIGGFVLAAVYHDTAASVIVAMTAIQVFISLAYAALPAVIVAEVPRSETGIANGVNSIARTVGSSLSSALISTLLVSLTVPGTALPRESAFVVAFAVGAVVAGLALLLTVIASTATRDQEADILVS